MGKNKNWFIESTVEANEVVINDGGSSVDFRIEGLSDANLLVTDGSENKVGIGTNIPSTKLDVSSDILGELLTISNHNTNATMPAVFDFKKSRGSKLSPTSIANADELGKISFTGYDGSNYDELAYIKVDSLVTASDTSQMTVHTDKIVIDTSTLQFGATGDYSSAVKGVHSSGVALDSSASDDYLVTAKTLYDNLELEALSGISWASPGSYIDSIPRLDTSSTLTASNIYSEGATGNVSIGADTVDEQSEKFKLTGTSSFIGALSVGINDVGHDVVFYGATAGVKLHWDESADALYIGESSGNLGADFAVYGKTAGYKLHWDEGKDTLLVHGEFIELGKVDTDIIKVHGEFKNYDDDAIFEFKASTASKSTDIFKIYDKNDNESFSVTANGTINLDTTALSFTNADSKIWFENKMYINSHTNSAGVIWVTDGGGFSLVDGSKTVFTVTKTDKDIEMSGNQDVWKSAHADGIKFVGPKVRIFGTGNAASLGLLEVNNISTSTGGLTLDSAAGTTTISDNTTITGNLTVSGTVTGTNQMTADYMLIDTDSGGIDLGLQRTTATGGPNSASNDLWLKTVTGDGTGGGGILTEYIYSNTANGLNLATDTGLQMITLSPNHGADGGYVNIGANASGNNANLTVYGDFVVHGDADFTNADTVSGINLQGTTSTTFQIDNNATPAGPKLKNISGEFAVTDKDDAGASIIAMGLKSQSGFGSGGMEIENYHSSIRLMPSTTGDSSNKYVDVRGSLVVNSRSGTISSIRDNVHLGNSSHSDFGTAVANDVVLFSSTGRFWSDNSENEIKMTGMDFTFNSLDESDFGSTFQLNGSASNYVKYTGSLLDLNNSSGVGTTVLNVKMGDVKLGKVSTPNTNVFIYGGQSEALLESNAHAGTGRYVKLGGGLLQPPLVSSTASIALETWSSSYQFANLTSASITYTLPAVADGLRFKIMVSDFTNDLIIVADGTNALKGGIATDDTNGAVAVSVKVSDGSDTTLTVKTPREGSWVEVISDGTDWFVSGTCYSDDHTDTKFS
jgi:hypothetical protein